MGGTLLQEDLIAKLGQEGASNGPNGSQAGPAADNLPQQMQADVRCCQLDCHWAPTPDANACCAKLLIMFGMSYHHARKAHHACHAHHAKMTLVFSKTGCGLKTQEIPCMHASHHMSKGIGKCLTIAANGGRSIVLHACIRILPQTSL